MSISRRGALALGATGLLTRHARVAPTLDRGAKIVIGLSPGAGLDGLARLLAEQLRGRYAP
jgi:tripartite-type tricarboxylate transporter receptor subunit TctC